MAPPALEVPPWLGAYETSKSSKQWDVARAEERSRKARADEGCAPKKPKLG
jgi:hypothetical protein